MVRMSYVLLTIIGVLKTSHGVSNCIHQYSSKLHFKMATFPRLFTIKSLSKSIKHLPNVKQFSPVFRWQPPNVNGVDLQDRKWQGYSEFADGSDLWSVYLLGSGKGPVASSCREKDLKPWRVLHPHHGAAHIRITRWQDLTNTSVGSGGPRDKLQSSVLSNLQSSEARLPCLLFTGVGSVGSLIPCNMLVFWCSFFLESESIEIYWFNW